MKRYGHGFFLIAVVAFFVCANQRGFAENIIQVRKIDPEDRAAVVKTSDGELVIVRQGETLKPFGRVISIEEGRMIFRNKNADTVILNLVDGKQSLQRISKVTSAGRQPVLNLSAGSGVGAANAPGVAPDRPSGTKD